MSRLVLHINGTGNAWPVPLGEDHPFYNRQHIDELANASVSVIEYDNQRVLRELLIDAGHGLIQHLLRYRNRIPEAMVITHPHLDHTVSIDWISQSYFKKWKKEKKYPVYCTRECFDGILNTYPHLEPILENKALYPGRKTAVEEIPGLELTAYPVYHGPSAAGSSAILVSAGKSKKVLVTGDLLTPLFRRSDLAEFTGIPCIVTDANNRFPYPRSNHWSVVSRDPTDRPSARLEEFIQSTGIHKMTSSFKAENDPEGFFPSLVDEWLPEDGIYSVCDLLAVLKPLHAVMLHYSGDEDYRYYNQEKLGIPGLKAWLSEIGKKDCPSVHFLVPLPGDQLEL